MHAPKSKWFGYKTSTQTTSTQEYTQTNGKYIFVTQAINHIENLSHKQSAT